MSATDLAPAVLAVKRLAEERLDLLQPVGDRPGREVEASRRRGHVLTAST